MHAAVRAMSPSELKADAVVHAVGLIFGVGACFALAALALPSGDPWLLLGLGVYATGLMAMLGCSALYNMTAADHPRSPVLRRLDHAAIFVMIAGTYTPFALLAIGGAYGRGLLVFVWTVATIGAVAKLVCPERIERTSIALYLVLGWSIVTGTGPLLTSLSPAGVALIAAGGLLYSVGIAFHVWRRLPYHNAIWHVFVLAGAVCHFAAVVGDVAAAG